MIDIQAESSRHNRYVLHRGKKEEKKKERIENLFTLNTKRAGLVPNTLSLECCIILHKYVQTQVTIDVYVILTLLRVFRFKRFGNILKSGRYTPGSLNS